MHELARLYGRKALLLLGAAVIINMGLFMLSCAPEKEITLTGAELAEYIAEYPDFLRKTKENAASLAALNMYKSGFAADNIRRSAKAYARLEDISAEYGDNRGAVVLVQYRLTDIFLPSFLMIMAVRLLSERKKGLAPLVRSTKGGRGALYLHRTAALALSAAAAAALLYGGNYIGMLIAFGKCDMSRAIQSLPEFRACPYSFTIGGYYLLSSAMKAFACFTAAMAFFLMISLLGTSTAYALTAALTAAELLLYLLIIPVSAANALKYVNIFAVMDSAELLSACRNLNIFGRAVPALECNIIFTAALAAALTAAGYFIHGRMYAISRDPLEGLTDKLRRAAERFPPRRSLMGWEGFKLFIKQGGILFMAAAFILTLTSALRYRYFYPVDFLEERWYDEYSGEITAETLERAESALERLDNNISRYEKQIEDMLTWEKCDDAMMGRVTGELDKAKRSRDALLPVLENIRDGYGYTERTGRRIKLVKPYSYDLLLNRDSRTRDRASLYILIGIIGAVSGVFAYDRQNNMLPALSAAYRGRRALTAAKTAVVLAACVTLCVSAHLIQLAQIGELLGYSDADAPVQSLMFMRDFKLHVSIRGYLILLFAVRAAGASAAGLICAGISRLCGDSASALGISVFALAVPAVLAQMIPQAKLINCVYLIGGEYFR